MRISILFFVVSLVLGACSRSLLPVHPANWVKNWPEDSNPVHFDSLSNLYYEVQRDENNIYLHFRTTDLATQMKLLRHGLSIYFDAETAKKESLGFTFPLPLPDSLVSSFMGRAERRGEGRPDEARNLRLSPEEMQRKILERVYMNFTERPKEMHLKGFDGPNKIILGKDPSDIQVDLELADQNTLNYYAIIPIGKISSKSKSGSDNFSLGIVSGFLSFDEQSPQMGGGGGRQGDAANQPQMSEEDRAKRREFMMKMMEQMTKPTEVWFKVDLKAGKKS
jgi:hypothetical protein